MNLSGQVCRAHLKATALGKPAPMGLLIRPVCPITWASQCSLVRCPHSKPHFLEGSGLFKWLFHVQLGCLLMVMCCLPARNEWGSAASLEGQLYFQAEEKTACVKRLEGEAGK